MFAQRRAVAPPGRRLRADEFRRDAGGVFEAFSRMSECVCDVLCFYGSLGSVVCVVCTDWSVVRDGTTSGVHDKTGECLAWA